jgi:hypothetical protein
LFSYSEVKQRVAAATQWFAHAMNVACWRWFGSQELYGLKQEKNGDSGDDLNVFELRGRLISDYSSYTRSSIRIRDERIDALVTSCLDQGRLWADPLIQLNPFFQYAGTIEDLVAEGVLHFECSRMFRAGTRAPTAVIFPRM